MKDRRQAIVDAALALLREQGYAGFTQPRVAARAGIRQSHLTYYFPSRADLFLAVARFAVTGQLMAADQMLQAHSPAAAARSISRLISRPENTRVLLALVAAADQEPPVRELFRELAAGLLERGRNLLTTLGAALPTDDAYVLHALSVGLAVTSLATGHADNEAHASRILERALRLLAAADSRAPSTAPTQQVQKLGRASRSPAGSPENAPQTKEKPS